MRKNIIFIAIFCVSFLLGSTISSCSPKVGCELNEGMTPKTNRKGELTKKRGSSNLFDKKKRRKMGY